MALDIPWLDLILQLEKTKVEKQLSSAGQEDQRSPVEMLRDDAEQVHDVYLMSNIH